MITLTKKNFIDLIQTHVPLEEHGSISSGYCPFCYDDEETFIAYPDEQKWHCFSCMQTGNIYEFIEQTEQLSAQNAEDYISCFIHHSLEKEDIATTVSHCSEPVLEKKADSEIEIADKETITSEAEIEVSEPDIAINESEEVPEQDDIAISAAEVEVSEVAITEVEVPEPDTAEAKVETEVKVPKPEITTSEPEITTSEPEIVTSEPEIATSEPEIATSEPEIAISEPEIAISEPEIAISEAETFILEADSINALETLLESFHKCEGCYGIAIIHSSDNKIIGSTIDDFDEKDIQALNSFIISTLKLTHGILGDFDNQNSKLIFRMNLTVKSVQKKLIWVPMLSKEKHKYNLLMLLEYNLSEKMLLIKLKNRLTAIDI